MVLPENMQLFSRDLTITSERKRTPGEGSGIMKCNICHKEYDGNHIPRLLSCGHSCCTPCIDNILSHNKKCPECKFTLKASSTTDFPVVYQLMKEATTIKETQTEISTLDVGICKAHDSLMFFRCMSCGVWACKDCLVIDHPQGRKNPNCHILSVPDAVEEIRITTPKKIDQEIRSIRATKDQMSSVLQNMTTIEKVYHTKIRGLEEELRKQENELKEILNKCHKAENGIEELNELERSLKEMKSIICSSQNPSDIKSAFDDKKTSHEYISSVIAKCKMISEESSSFTTPPRPVYAPEIVAAARPPPPPVYEIPRNNEYLPPPPEKALTKKDKSTNPPKEKSKNPPKEKSKGSKDKDPFPARKVPFVRRFSGDLLRK